MASSIVSLGYGRAPLRVEVPAHAIVVPPPGRRLRPISLAEALARPLGADRLRGRVRSGARVTIIVSDRTRDEPRGDLVRAVLDEIRVGVDLTIAIANGTHDPGDVGTLGLGLPAGSVSYAHDMAHPPPPPPGEHTAAERLSRPVVRNHDAGDLEAFVDLGVTRRGTRVRLPRWLLEQDLVVATGRIRPHYFAGFGAGAKAVFPGLGVREDIRQNHLLKRDPTSRIGNVTSNACRDDIEEAVGMLPVETHLLNVVVDDGGALAAVAGELVEAHRAGCEIARRLCEAPCPRADLVITSDALPLSGSLYQASKLLVPAAMILDPGGTAVLAAECPFGTGPLDVVNKGIYELGLRHLFPAAHTIHLVSSLSESTVSSTYCRYAPSVDSVLAAHRGRIAVLPAAGNLLPVPT
jgi:nickel-dependent lactate racemase